MRKIFSLALVAVGLLTAGHARADVFGRLRVQVKVAPGRPQGPPTAGMQVTLRDTAGVRGDVVLTLGKDGSALSPPLENHAWQMVRVAPAPKGRNLLPSPQSVQVTADTATDVTLTVDPARDKVIVITEGEGAQTALVYRRDQAFLRKYPITVGDPQRFGPVLRTVPGVAR